MVLAYSAASRGVNRDRPGNERVVNKMIMISKQRDLKYHLESKLDIPLMLANWVR